MVELSRQRSKAVVNSLIEVSEILQGRDDVEISKEIVKLADPSFIMFGKDDYVARWIVDLLTSLTILYDKGYDDCLEDIQRGR